MARQRRNESGGTGGETTKERERREGGGGWWRDNEETRAEMTPPAYTCAPLILRRAKRCSYAELERPSSAFSSARHCNAAFFFKATIDDVAEERGCSPVRSQRVIGLVHVAYLVAVRKALSKTTVRAFNATFRRSRRQHLYEYAAWCLCCQVQCCYQKHTCEHGHV